MRRSGCADSDPCPRFRYRLKVLLLAKRESHVPVNAYRRMMPNMPMQTDCRFASTADHPNR
jgi:hypothetical protein